MALARRIIRLPTLPTAKNCSFSANNHNFIHHISGMPSNSLSLSAWSHGPLLQKLLQAPLSAIKMTLDSEASYKTPGFSWAVLLASLNASSAQKAGLVMEWILEKLNEEKEKNHSHYSELITLCGGIRNWEVALHVITAMEAQGLEPVTSVFNSLISTCLASGNLVKALSLFEIMEMSEGCKPDSDTYNAFISAYAKLGNKKAAEAWFSAKKTSGFSADLQAYDFLILACIKSKNFGDAETYYEEMILAGLLPNESVLENMLVVYYGGRNFIKVKEVLKFMLDGGCRLNRITARKVVGFFIEVGKVEEMEKLFEALMKSNQGSEILSMVHSLIIRMYAKADRLDDVEYSVGRMLKQGISFSCPDDVDQVVCSYFRQQAYERLDLFLACIKGSYKLTKSNCDFLAAGYRRAGLYEKLNVLMNDMKPAGLS